jgi:threonine synthase
MTATITDRISLLPQRCRLCKTEFAAAAIAICENCLGPLEPLYPSARALPTRTEIESRAPSLWRYREWLPFEGPGDGFLSAETGFTPLIDAPRLAALLGIDRCWVKNDSVCQPTLSFKDRVVATSINAARALNLDTVGCASTGNLANAVASHAARAGLAAWIFVPEDLEVGKIVGTAVYGPNLVRIKGHYDDVNRLCAQLADRFGWGIVNVNLRGYYGEGSKTVAFEMMEQLGWRFPTAVIAPMAGGSLVTKLKKGFKEFADAGLVGGTAPRLYGAQAAGCAPIVRCFETFVSRQIAGDPNAKPEIVPEVPKTIAKSIAIGNPADGVFAAHAMRLSGGWAAAVTDAEIVAGIRLLAETTGIFTETAGGTTVAAALKLAKEGRLRGSDELVVCITGNGLKTVEAMEGALTEAPVVRASVRDVAALVEQREKGTGSFGV